MALIEDINAALAGGAESRAVQRVLANCHRMKKSVDGRKGNIDRVVADTSFSDLPQSIKDEGVTVLDGIEQFRTFMGNHLEFFGNQIEEPVE